MSDPFARPARTCQHCGTLRQFAYGAWFCPECDDASLAATLAGRHHRDREHRTDVA